MKHEQNIDCGGGYVKVFGSDLDQVGMHGDSPYHIMFGPDICGSGTKKVHVIFTHKGKNHLVNKEIRCKVSLNQFDIGSKHMGQPILKIEMSLFFGQVSKITILMSSNCKSRLG